ncbi:MAG: hypothetical protein IT359_02080 [Gemmatimonadaceae bacterium]|nr:hypothetical protein [Gemmatimonadaceae bacterium]
MSTVLWANVLVDGAVTSDESDHLALYQHAERLDAITRELQLKPFLEICDTTDQRYNVEGHELPPGMTSTNELMAAEGSWMPLAGALAMLEALRGHIVAKNVRFGLLRNQQAQVLAELDEVIAFAREHAVREGEFNFAVVM